MEKADTASFLEKYLTPIAVVVGALIIAGAFAFGNPNNQAVQDRGDQKAIVDIKEVTLDNAIVIGNPDAPVTVAYWFDYQCPFCKKFDQESMTQIHKEYVETGKVKVVIKDFQFLGPDSEEAGVFARAVWETYPQHFFTWYQEMFEAQDEEHGGFGDTDSIVAMTKAKVPGIDTDRVLALIAQKESAYKATLAADRDEGSSLGINGTPATIIGTELYSGAQPYAVIKAAIDAELAK